MRLRFRSKLTALYSVLFLMVFLPTILIVRAEVIGGVKQNIEVELQASGAVFDRILSLRGSQLEEAATLLAADFGFRSAVATRDEATVESALTNVTARLGGSRALMVGLDGVIIAATDTSAGEPFVYDGLLIEDRHPISGAGMLAGAPHLLVSAPILSPVLAGWVVFTLELDQATEAELESLSALSLRAMISHGDDLARSASLGEGVVEIQTPAGPVLTYVVNLAVAEGSEPIALTLSHPLDVALRPYDRMLLVIFSLGLLGIVLLGGGSWLLAGQVTRPLRALSHAVGQLKIGRRASVTVETRDEFGELGLGFNLMSEEIQSREEAISHMALHDMETGLPNRHQLEALLRERLTQDSGTRLVLLTIRVQRYTNVRTAIGFELAAQFLQRLAERLEPEQSASACARLATGTLCIMRTLHADEDLEEYCLRLREAISAPVRLGKHAVDVTLVIGAARAEDAAMAPETLVQRAEIALDQAEAGGHPVAIYDVDQFQDPIANLTLMSEMQMALASGDISLHYQPKVALRSGLVTEAEALLRWTHPVRGFVSPDHFVAMAEETGHIAQLSHWVVERALADQKTWRQAGLDITVGINMSGRLLANRSFTDFMISAIERHGSTAKTIVLEITETAVMDHPDRALEQLKRLRDAGFSLSIDDYGTGLSSLSYLKDLPVNELKIDKSFVLNLSRDEQDRVLVRSTIDLARNLGLQVTAEGVEDEAALAALQLFGCDFAQGYFISKAIPDADFQAFATQWNDRSDPAMPKQAQGG
jgi:predicted signal transduction protein with EAL and GGDEF domain